MTTNNILEIAALHQCKVRMTVYENGFVQLVIAGDKLKRQTVRHIIEVNKPYGMTFLYKEQRFMFGRSKVKFAYKNYRYERGKHVPVKGWRE